MRTVTLLGSTGSIGVSTLDLFEQATAHGSAKVEVIALTAGRNVNLLIEQCLKWRPQFAVIADELEFQALRNGLAGSGIRCGAGALAVVEAAAMEAQWVMSAIVGFAGLAPTLEAAKRRGHCSGQQGKLGLRRSSPDRNSAPGGRNHHPCRQRTFRYFPSFASGPRKARFSPHSYRIWRAIQDMDARRDGWGHP